MIDDQDAVVRKGRRKYALASRVALLLPLIDAALRVLPFGRVLAWLPAPAIARAGSSPPVAEARGIAAIVEAVTAEWPWPGHCLRTAVASYIVMTRRGIPVRLVIGVERPDAAFSAHAWVECGGEPVACGPRSAPCTVLWTSDAKPVNLA